MVMLRRHQRLSNGRQEMAAPLLSLRPEKHNAHKNETSLWKSQTKILPGDPSLWDRIEREPTSINGLKG